MDCHTLYKTSNIIEFYKETLEKVLGKDAELSKVFIKLSLQATDIFYACLENESKQMQTLIPV
jgi:hypothetical protein